MGRKSKADHIYTEVCGKYSPSLNDSPDRGKLTRIPSGTAPYQCPRCGGSSERKNSIKRHFPSCIRKNGNPDRLHWFDHESIGPTDMPPLREQTQKNTHMDLEIPAAQREVEATASRSNNLNNVEPSPTHNSTGAEPALPMSSHTDEMPKHPDFPAHRINNSGFLMPLNTETGSATESLGEVSSLGESSSHDSDDQDGQSWMDEWLLDDDEITEEVESETSIQFTIVLLLIN